MVVGHIKNINLDKYRFPESVQRGFEYILTHDFTEMAPGRYVIDGDKLYANLDSYVTRVKEECRPEAHRKYIDIQYIVKGQEIIGYSSVLDGLNISEPYDEKRDIIFFEDMHAESGLVMTEGMYAIFYPQDVHRPCCQIEKSEDMLKVVVKVQVDVL